MGLSKKVFLARLERSGSLNQIIFLFFGVLTIVVLLLFFSDTLFSDNSFESKYGTYEGKNQSIYLNK